MIITLLCWLYILPLCWVYGLLILDVLRTASGDREAVIPPAVIPFVGLAGIGALGSWLYLGIKLGLVAQLILFGIALVYCVWRRSYWLKRVRLTVHTAITEWTHSFLDLLLGSLGTITILLFLGILLFRSASAIFYYDTGLYHLQAIDWMNRFSIVPGLGNLHHRFAFNSEWLLLNALFNFSFIFDRPVHTLNCLILFITTTAAIFNLVKILRGKICFSSLFQALLLIPIVYFFYDPIEPVASSPSTDLPAYLAIFLVLVLIIQYGQQNLEQADTKLLAALINLIIGFALVVKLSSLPIGLFVIFSVYQEWRKGGIKGAVISIAPFIFILLPWLITNIILSGYLIFPLHELGAFNVDWKIPIEVAKLERINMASWSRMPEMKPEDVLGHGISRWLLSWFARFKLTQEYQYLIASAIVLLLYVTLQRGKALQLLKQHAAGFSLLLFGLIFWFQSSPSVRHGRAWLWSLAILIFTTASFPLLQKLAKNQKSYQAIILPIVTFAFIISFHHQWITIDKYLEMYEADAYKHFSYAGQLYMSDRYHFAYPQRSFLIFPMPYPEFPVSSALIDGQTIYLSPVDDDRCWTSHFPCAPSFRFNASQAEQLQLRGSSFQAGFRSVPKLPKSD